MCVHCTLYSVQRADVSAYIDELSYVNKFAFISNVMRVVYGNIIMEIFGATKINK